MWDKRPLTCGIDTHGPSGHKAPEIGTFMATLKELLGNGDRREQVVDDACVVLDQEVADKGGLSGAAIKTAFKVVKGVKPGFIREVVNNLLDDFLDALDPIYQDALATNTAPGAHLRANSGPAAESLLAITDARAARAERAVVKKTYEKLRPSAKKHVEAAMPRLSELLERHLATA